MKEEIVKCGGRYFGTDEANVVFDGKCILRKDNGESICIKEFSEKFTYNIIHEQLVTTGSFVPKKDAAPYTAGFAEVEVDLETGKVEVIEFVEIVDCGTPINPNLAKIQAEGGVSNGIGLALFEEVKYDEKGRLVTDTFMEYKIPTRKDHLKITIELADGYDETGPYGAKSIGEVVINPVAPAITNAIFNACGGRIRNLPSTPEKVLMKLLSDNVSVIRTPDKWSWRV